MPQDQTDRPMSETRMAMESGVRRERRLTIPVLALELSSEPPAAACTSRAKNGLPSVRKHTSET
jgi:hypothetical protein